MSEKVVGRNRTKEQEECLLTKSISWLTKALTDTSRGPNQVDMFVFVLFSGRPNRKTNTWTQGTPTKISEQSVRNFFLNVLWFST